MGRVDFMNDGVQRINQIVDWIREEIYLSGLATQLKETEILLNSPDINDRKQGITFFNNIILHPNIDETLTYLIKSNYFKFGKIKVLRTLIYYTFKKRPSVSTVRGGIRTKPVKTKVKEEFVVSAIVKGKEVKAKPETFRRHNKTIIVLRDKKGRFVKRK